ncbi:TetR/AcrR family transcriptional regulator [Sinorhizobium fredii]|uniref:TetR/AcrR family transcriptional regulator n=1 Tax=Rhizobium fredii TaxID=380 RepID=UPI003513B504
MQEKSPTKKRPRGRPQVRCDDDTRGVILEAANEEFKKAGYASTNISTIAQTAGVSTKTLYRLFPTKADLFSDVISTKISGYLLSLDEDSLAALPLRQGLERLLIAYGRLTLSAETIVMTRLVLSESDRFPEIASVFYEQAIRRTSKAMEGWLARQAKLNALRLEDVSMATGMLRGMMAMEPQRAAMLGQIGEISDDQIVARAQTCVNLFLDGCSK